MPVGISWQKHLGRIFIKMLILRMTQVIRLKVIHLKSNKTKFFVFIIHYDIKIILVYKVIDNNIISKSLYIFRRSAEKIKRIIVELQPLFNH